MHINGLVPTRNWSLHTAGAYAPLVLLTLCAHETGRAQSGCFASPFLIDYRHPPFLTDLCHLHFSLTTNISISHSLLASSISH